MSEPATYLITGAGGGVGGISAMVIGRLLANGRRVRAMVHREGTRAQALRADGAEVIIGDLTKPGDVAAALAGVDRMFFNMSVSEQYLEATMVVCALAAETATLQVMANMSQMTVSQMTPTRTAESRQQRWHWLTEHVVDWSPIPAVHVRPTVFLENPLFTVLAAESIRTHDVLALPFSSGRTSPVAGSDVADAVVAILEDPNPHLGHVYELTGPTTFDVDGLAGQYSRALDRTIRGQRLDVEDWERALGDSGLDAHTQQHISTMARLHRDDRYNRSTTDVDTLTGHPAQSVADFVHHHRDLYTPTLGATRVR